MPEFQERGYPGVRERRTAGIAPQDRPCMTQGIPGPLSAWLSTVTEGIEERCHAPACPTCDCPSTPGDLAH